MITLLAKDFKDKLSLCRSVINPKHDTYPHIRLFTEDVLYMEGTDGVVSVKTSCGVKIDSPLTMSLPIGDLWGVVSTLPKESTIVLEEKDGGLLITCGDVVALVRGSDDYTPLQFPVIRGSYQIPGKDLSKLFSQTLISTGKSENRPVLDGVKLYAGDGDLRVAATDGFKISEATAKFSGPSSTFVVPSSAASFICKTVAGMSSLYYDSTSFGVAYNGTVVKSQLIQPDNFPDYPKFLSDIILYDSVWSREDMTVALKQIQNVAQYTNNGASFSFTGESAGITAVSNHKGSIQTKVHTKKAKGNPVTLNIQVVHFLQALSVISEPTFTLQIAEHPHKLVYILSGGCRHILVGMRI
jgi:DNA polymerase III sliding clamp (beta) subunit (PCNA family)